MLSFGHCTCAGAADRRVDVRCAEGDQARDDRPGLRHLLGLLVGGEILVREVHQARDAGINCRNHRGAAHRVHVDLHADLFRLVHDRLEDLYFGLRRGGLRRQADFAGVFDPLGGQRLDGRARFRRRLPEVHLARRDDARADELALVDAVAQRDVRFGLSAAGKDRGVAGLEQRPHLRRRVLAVADVLVAVDEAWHRAHAPGVDDPQPLRWGRAGAHRGNLSPAHDDGARLDHLAAPDDHPRIGDGHILRRRRSRRDRGSHRQARRHKDSHHRSPLSRN